MTPLHENGIRQYHPLYFLDDCGYSSANLLFDVGSLPNVIRRNNRIRVVPAVQHNSEVRFMDANRSRIAIRLFRFIFFVCAFLFFIFSISGPLLVTRCAIVLQHQHFVMIHASIPKQGELQVGLDRFGCKFVRAGVSDRPRPV